MKYSFTTEDTFTVITISGNMDTAESTRELDEAISAKITEGFHHFIFNLEKTTYLDSAGISVFIHCLCDVQDNKGSIFIIAQDNQVRRVLEMVGINRLIKTYSSMQEMRTEQQMTR